jgi:hypothetical protein
MFYVVSYVKKNDGVGGFEFDNLVVLVETERDVVEYLSRVGAWMKTHCRPSDHYTSDYYTDPPVVMLAVDGRASHKGCEVLSFEGLVRWILNQCDMPSARRSGGECQRYPVSDGVPVTKAYIEVPGTFPLE